MPARTKNFASSLNLVILALWQVSSPAWAQEAFSGTGSMIEIGQQPEQLALLVDEEASASSDQFKATLVLGSREQLDSMLNGNENDEQGGVTPVQSGVAAGWSAGLTSFFITLSASAGYQLLEFLEAGVEGGILIPFITVGGYAGAYMKLAPLPVGYAKRVYLGGKVTRAFILSPVDGGAVGLGRPQEFSVGYRHLTESARANGSYWFLEAGRVSAMNEDSQKEIAFSLRAGWTGLRRNRRR
jgi:hypothetical protein